MKWIKTYDSYSDLVKYLKTYKLFESVKEDIEIILNGVSDSSVEPIANKFDYKLQLWNLNRKNPLTDDEIEEVSGRLGDLGYKILRIIEHEPTFVCSVIDINFYQELKNKNVIFWNDLQWSDWRLNKQTSSNCLHTKINIDGRNLSIINGLHNGPNQIDCIEFWIEEDDFEFRCYDEASAEMTLIEIQIGNI